MTKNRNRARRKAAPPGAPEIKIVESAPILTAAVGREQARRFSGVKGNDQVRYVQRAISADKARRELVSPTRRELSTFEQIKPSWVDDSVQPIGILRGYSSTREIDSYNEVVVPSGWGKHLPKFLEFPVYLYGHDYWSMPIGLVNRLEIDEYGLWTERFIFGTQAGQEAWLLARAGVLRADSVGYILHDWTPGHGDAPDYHTEQELLEISLVMIPSNRASTADELEPGPGAKATGWDELLASEEIPAEAKNLKVKHLTPVPESWRKTSAEPPRAPNVRRISAMDPEVIKAVQKEIDEALAPFKKETEGSSAQVKQLSEQIDKLAKAQGEAREALADKVKQSVNDIQTKLDKIVPDFTKLTDELSDKITAVERKMIPQGSLRRSPFTTKQLAYTPMARVTAAHDKGLADNVEHFQQKTDHLVFLDMLMEGHSEKFGGDYHTQPREKRIKGLRFFDEWDSLRKAMDTSTAGEGAEWIPEDVSPRIEELIRQRLRISSQFRVIQMPSNPYTAPVLTSDTEAKLIGETTTVVSPADTTNEETPGTSKVTWTAKKARGRIQISEEFNEDSVRPMVPLMEEVVVRSIARARDNAALNGDTTATHQDSDVTAATEFRKAFKGLRKHTLAAAKKDYTDYTSGTTQILLALRDARASMGKYGEWSDDLALFSSLKVILSLMLAIDQVQTLEKLGPQAVIKTGQLAMVDGMAVIPTEFSRDDLNATGVYDNTTKTKAILTIANTQAYVWGEKGSVRIGSEFYLMHQVFQIVAWHRFDFEPLYDATAEPMTSQVVNIGFA